MSFDPDWIFAGFFFVGVLVFLAFWVYVTYLAVRAL